MSSSTLKPRLLLDENVRAEIFQFLKTQKFNVKYAAKNSSDNTIAAISAKEKRIIITNDADFCAKRADQVFAVIWLRISQRDLAGLVSSLSKFFDSVSIKQCRGKLTVLHVNRWEFFRLSREE